MSTIDSTNWPFRQCNEDERIYKLEEKVDKIIKCLYDGGLDFKGLYGGALEKSKSIRRYRRINISREKEMSCCLQKEMDELESIADEDCTCTEAQQSGDDPSVCKSCEASHLINQIGEDLRHGLGNLQKKK
jgi:hypothetical protein